MCEIEGMNLDAYDGSAELCRVLDEDTELAEEIPLEHRQRAARDCIATTLTLPSGLWPATTTIDPGDQGMGMGLLVLRGLLIRRVGVDGRYGAELLGTGDLLRPWQGEDGPPSLTVATAWRVIEPVRLAVLDQAFARRAARYPSLSAHLIARALKRARNLSINMAIVHQARVYTRLHILLWYLAARWGKVRSDGVSLPLRLTHSVLADLTAARRPTVTSALADLARDELISQVDDGWLLHGQPPGELFELMTVPANLTVGVPSRTSSPH